MKKIKIWQLNSENEIARNLVYMSYKWSKKRLSLELYNKVWEGEINDAYDLDDIYHEFNLNHPADFTGHSLSTSDVVEMDEKFFFCDSYGWVELNWSEPKEFVAIAVDPHGNDHKVWVKAGDDADATKKVYALGYVNVVQVIEC